MINDLEAPDPESLSRPLSFRNTVVRMLFAWSFIVLAWMWFREYLPSLLVYDISPEFDLPLRLHPLIYLIIDALITCIAVLGFLMPDKRWLGIIMLLGWAWILYHQRHSGIVPHGSYWPFISMLPVIVRQDYLEKRFTIWLTLTCGLLVGVALFSTFSGENWKYGTEPWLGIGQPLPDMLWAPMLIGLFFPGWRSWLALYGFVLLVASAWIFDINFIAKSMVLAPFVNWNQLHTFFKEQLEPS
jgi:hypothetical protein